MNKNVEKVFYILIVLFIIATSVSIRYRAEQAVVDISDEYTPTPAPVIAPSLEPTSEELKPIKRGDVAQLITLSNIKPERVAEPSIEDTYAYEIVYLAKTVWGEARGCSTVEQAGVIWCILNRVDAGQGDIIDVVTAPGQFHGYNVSFPVENDIYNLVVDVLGRWEAEHDGATDVGRVLPSDYLWFAGDGAHNYFRNAFNGGTRWDWSFANPYI